MPWDFPDGVLVEVTGFKDESVPLMLLMATLFISVDNHAMGFDESVFGFGATCGMCPLICDKKKKGGSM